MSDGKSLEPKVYLNKEANDFHRAAAKRRGISLSEWFRLIPFLLTEDEVKLVREFRKQADEESKLIRGYRTR